MHPYQRGKTIVCPICTKRLSQNRQAETHLKLHPELADCRWKECFHQCNLCEYYTIQKSNLNIHKKAKHKECRAQTLLHTTKLMPLSSICHGTLWSDFIGGTKVHAQRANETLFQASTPTVSSARDTLPTPPILVNDYATTRGVTQVSSDDYDTMFFGRTLSQPWGSYETRNYGPHQVDGMNLFPPPQLDIYSIPLATGEPQRSYYAQYYPHNGAGSSADDYNYSQGTCSLYPLAYSMPT